MGTWALDVPTADYLLLRLTRERPRTVLEFGAGLSSVLLAEYARRERAAGRETLIVSVEQDAAVAERTTKRLTDLGMAAGCRVMHCPVDANGRYDVQAERLDAILEGRPLDCVLIDGPCGPAGCRRWTVDAVARWCRAGTRWFLDDALRDAEIDVMRRWHHHPALHVDGIVAVGKGLGVGHFTGRLTGW